MNGTSSRQKAIGPRPTSMKGRRRPSGVWNVSLQGPTTGDRVSGKNPSAPITSPITESEVVKLCSSVGSETEMVEIVKARTTVPSLRVHGMLRLIGENVG